ncbi:MAG: putative Na+/H+ antiporter [Pseudobdellovibrionaceae bacterium]
MDRIEILGTALFALAVLHTFVASYFVRFSHRFPKGSGREAFFHLLGEVEVVFGFWAAILMLILAIMESPQFAISYQESLDFTEPLFVFCIMVVAATKPLLQAARGFIARMGALLAKILKLPQAPADIFVILTLGPLSGSLITEPAAMTVTALLLAAMIRKPEKRFMYFLLGTLFVNVSIGGALTHFAAPPILMVAGKWEWGLGYVFSHFGWKSLLAVTLNSLIFVGLNFRKIQDCCQSLNEKEDMVSSSSWWVAVTHLGFLVGLVLTSHYKSTMMGIFLFFLGFTAVTRKYQSGLRFRESLLVAFFLGGIVMFGGFQRWWLEPILTTLEPGILYLAATALTAITDNAALTFLGSQVPHLSEAAKYFLVAGAIAGGGLTVIANAPNAAGYSVLQKFLPNGLNSGALFVGALIPTLVAVLALGLL